MIAKVRVESKAVERSFRDIGRSQMPFAISGAINDALFRGRRFTLAYWRRTFPRRKNDRFPGVVVRVRTATKRRLSGAIFDSRGLALMGIQIAGGTRRPEGGGELLVPTENVSFTRTGRPRRSATRNLIRINDTLFQRVGRGRNKTLRAMFHLARSARIKRAFVLRPILVRTRRYFSRALPGRIERAIRTAR